MRYEGEPGARREHAPDAAGRAPRIRRTGRRGRAAPTGPLPRARARQARADGVLMRRRDRFCPRAGRVVCSCAGRAGPSPCRAGGVLRRRTAGFDPVPDRLGPSPPWACSVTPP
ncbi:hypothetical protein CH313_20815 [Streptomyces sp. TSRI0384-2]|nr:hypothetical protein CH313_20815 [Streptomyces sp. TSRI0384-2]